MKKKLTAKVVNCTRVFNGHFKVDRYEIEQERHEGGIMRVTREVFERGHAVAMLAYDTKRDLVLLVQEMRAGILAAGEYPYTDTLPAGGINKGESAIDAAAREMEEETGLVLKNPKLVQPGSYVSPGGTSEKIAIVYGTVDTSKAGGIHGEANENEDIRTVLISSKEFMKRIKSGAINDMKTQLAGYWLMEHVIRPREQRKKAKGFQAYY